VAHHVYRTAVVGAWVLIRESWYKATAANQARAADIIGMLPINQAILNLLICNLYRSDHASAEWTKCMSLTVSEDELLQSSVAWCG